MTAWWCKLPETGWQKELDALEHLIVDKGILERDVDRNRSALADAIFLRAEERREEERSNGGKRPNGRDGPLARRTTKFPPTAPAWCRRWTSARPRSPVLIGRAEPGSLKVLGSALRESQGIRGRHRDQPGAGRGIHPRLRRRGREPCRCPHPECADLGQLRPARSASPPRRDGAGRRPGLRRASARAAGRRPRPLPAGRP